MTERIGRRSPGIRWFSKAILEMDAEKSDADNRDTGCSPQILGKCGCVGVKPRYYFKY